MALKTLTIRVPEEKVEVLDCMAEFERRDRSFLVNQAIDNLIALEQYNRDMLEEGLRDIAAGRLVPHEQLVAEFRAHGAKPKGKRRAS